MSRPAPRRATTESFHSELQALSEHDRLVAEATAANELFDAEFYLDVNQDVAQVGMDALSHYCIYGWKEGRRPRADFDTRWYSMMHLPGHPQMNPLAHYVRVGRAQGLATKRDRVEPPLPAAALTAPVRRCILFAGYSAEGVLDAAAVAYLTELARHGDVYYRADCELRPGELAKLDGIVAGAWDGRHGSYDFGSYARLATEHVGWRGLQSYDEVLLVNDSCFLLRKLDDLFARMDAQACAWWGLQATEKEANKWFGPTHRVPVEEGKPRKIVREPVGLLRMAESLSSMLTSATMTDFHLGSYFLAFRRPVLDDQRFRRRLEQAMTVESKNAAIATEIGLSQLLIAIGHRFATFVPGLFPYHPVLGASAFDLIDRGFPLLKRRLLTDNPLRVPMHDWRERVAAAVPEPPFALIEASLATAQGVPAHQAVASSTPEPVAYDADAFVAADAAGTSYPDVWAFPVCAFDHLLTGNDRAVFEEVRHDPSITKVILTRSRPVDLDGANVVTVPLGSREGQDWLIKAGVVFTKHGPYVNVPWPLDPRHRVINLWHGIPLKRFGTASLDTTDRRDGIAAINRACHAVVTSSEVDSLAMAAAFRPLTVHDMWPTGLPRNDYVLLAEDRLPDDMRAELDALRSELDGRRLVMFLPTFKNGQADAYYDFSGAELDRLRKWAEQNRAVIGIREHMADTAHSYARALAPLSPIDLSAARFPNLEVIYRAADALISDYSSCLVDYLLTGRPVISFAYDLDRYADAERGLFYDLDETLPGPVCRTFDELAASLDGVFDERSPEQLVEYDRRRSLFFDHLDDAASARVVARVRTLVGL